MEGHRGHRDLDCLPSGNGDLHPGQDRGGCHPQERPEAEVSHERPRLLLPVACCLLRRLLARAAEPILRLVESGGPAHVQRHHCQAHGPVAVRRLWPPVAAPRRRPRVRGGLGRLPPQRVLQRLLPRRGAEPAPLPPLAEGALRPEALLERSPGPDALGHCEPVLPRRDVLRLPCPRRRGALHGDGRLAPHQPRSSDDHPRALVLHLRLQLERARVPDNHRHPARPVWLDAHLWRLGLPRLVLQLCLLRVSRVPGRSADGQLLPLRHRHAYAHRGDVPLPCDEHPEAQLQDLHRGGRRPLQVQGLGKACGVHQNRGGQLPPDFWLVEFRPPFQLHWRLGDVPWLDHRLQRPQARLPLDPPELLRLLLADGHSPHVPRREPLPCEVQEGLGKVRGARALADPAECLLKQANHCFGFSRQGGARTSMMSYAQRYVFE
mmetsp:Transcript_95809/g.270862  ORF Transcript_95809/g.270862 Transcript_95809/m.270862 type:complete len:435 (+) Transcript_95809:297-1601(+)